MVIVKSDLKDLVFPEDRNCTDWLLEQISDETDKTALINSETGEQFSYSDVRRLVPLVCASLLRCGVKKGDVMCMFTKNSLDYAILVLAALKAQVIITGVNVDFTPDELKRQLDDGEVTYLFTKPEFLHKVKATGSAFNRLKMVFVEGQAPGCVSYASLLETQHGIPAPGPEICIDAKNTMALLLYSSGTTGLPKGVKTTHFNIVSNLMQIANPVAPMTRREGEVLVEFAPFYHVYGLLLGLFNMLLRRGTLVTMPTFNYETYLSLLEKYRATYLKIMPSIVLRMSKDLRLKDFDLSSARGGNVGSAPSAPEVIQDMSRKFGTSDFSQCWGMTETTCIGSNSPPGYPVKLASVGKLVSNTEAKVVNPETLEELELGQTGELWLRGPQVMLGYWKNPKATQDTITKDGWLRTGDIVYIDSDHYIFIVDRLKEMIKFKGFQVAPAELEAVVLSHPGVADAAVIGVKDEIAGEIPRAYVVLRESHLQSVKGKDIEEHVKDCVAKYKRLRGGVVFVDQIPKSPTGKILRRQLRDKANKVLSRL